MFVQNLKSIIIMTLSMVMISSVKADGETDHGGSLFSIFSSETPFEAIVNDVEYTPGNVRTFYHSMKNKPVWFEAGRLNAIGKVAIEVLRNSYQEGLNPGDYEDAIQVLEHPENWIESEILLTYRFLEFIDHVRVGRIDPMDVSQDIKFHNSKTHSVELLVEALQNQNDQRDRLRHMAPSLPQYIALKEILAHYREQSQNITNWPKLGVDKTLKLGDVGPQIQILRQLLVHYGYLAQDQETGEKFDIQVLAALKAFQKRYSLEPDGEVGAKTREALNYSLEERIKKVIVNMERLRWLPDDLGHKYLIVNVAGYVLHGFEESEVTIMMPVIVGRPDRRTPLFYAKLKNIVINPSWGVPQSIFLKDKLPKIRKDPKYIERSKFTIIDTKGRIIDPDAADWQNEGKNYSLRQSPGRHNALGPIKFNIENPYVIYLHGTPDQHLFAKKARAFSSGCIRVKHPLKLAQWVLNHNSEWSCEALEAAITAGETQILKPHEYIPVYFTYQTLWVKSKEKGNNIIFSNDPYGLDAKMIKMMDVRA